MVEGGGDAVRQVQELTFPGKNRFDLDEVVLSGRRSRDPVDPTLAPGLRVLLQEGLQLLELRKCLRVAWQRFQNLEKIDSRIRLSMSFSIR